jgi:hypothetical protein
MADVESHGHMPICANHMLLGYNHETMAMPRFETITGVTTSCPFT